jgi:hypothetical protein
MAIYGLDAAGNAAYVEATGAGSAGDPYIVKNDAFTTELRTAFVNAAASGVDVIAAVSATKLRVMSMAITTGTAGRIRLQSGGSSDRTANFHLPANGSLTLSNSLGLFETNSGEKLNALASGTTDYSVMVTYREVPA